MKRHPFFLSSAVSLAFFVSTAAKAAEVTPTEPSVAPAWVSTQTKVHAMGGSLAIDNGALTLARKVSIAVSLKLRNKDELDTLTAQLASDQPPKPLTSEQFLDRHAPTRNQAVKVINYLVSLGFTNVSMSDNRMLVTADGTPFQIKRAFNTELHAFNVNGRAAYANVTEAQIPATLSDTVLAVTGLQTVFQAHTMLQRRKAGAVSPHDVTSLYPNQFAAIYGASGLPSASKATIAIVGAGDMNYATVDDLKTFAAKSGYPVPPVRVVTVGAPSSDFSNTEEWNLDTQTALAAAGGTIGSMIIYSGYALDDASLTAVFNKAVSDNTAKVINVSLGECEISAKSSGFQATNDQIFQAAVAQGQTFSVSTGDVGAYECGGTTVAQSYPAVSPYVMAIGGTTLSNSGGTTWAGETAWTCEDAPYFPAPQLCPLLGGTGGGKSLTEPAAPWQIAAGVLATGGQRGVPDLAFDADPASGAVIIVSGEEETIGGTSLSAPLFTGFYSRVQAVHGNTLGFPAQNLYKNAKSNQNWFHDITEGANGGSVAGAGWDYVSGYGSLQVQNFSAGISLGTVLVVDFSCVPTNLTLQCTDKSSDFNGGVIGSHVWTFDDGTKSTETNPTHQYAKAGTYKISEVVTERGTSKTDSKSQTFTLPVPPKQVVVNTGFETGSAPWTLTPGVVCSNDACEGETSHSGKAFAWLNGYGTTHTDVAKQTINLPTGNTATLSFYLHIDTTEPKTTAVDKLLVQVFNPNTSVTTTLATYSNLDAASGYVLKSFDMKPYIGQAALIQFVGSENASKPTSFVIDDVTVTVKY